MIWPKNLHVTYHLFSYTYFMTYSSGFVIVIPDKTTISVVSWHQMDTRLTRFVLDTRLVLEHRRKQWGGRVPPEITVRGTPMLFVPPPDFDHLRREKRQNLVPKYTKIQFFSGLCPEPRWGSLQRSPQTP